MKHEWIVKAVAHVDHKKNEKALKASPDWSELFGVPIGERRVAPCSGCGCVGPLRLIQSRDVDVGPQNQPWSEVVTRTLEIHKETHHSGKVRIPSIAL